MLRPSYARHTRLILWCATITLLLICGCVCTHTRSWKIVVAFIQPWRRGTCLFCYCSFYCSRVIALHVLVEEEEKREHQQTRRSD